MDKNIRKAEYYVCRDEETGRILYLKPKKSLILKRDTGKFEEVTQEEYYGYSRNNLITKGFYTMNPSISGTTLQEYLLKKSIFANKHKFSDFNCRTIWNLLNAKTSTKEANLPGFEGPVKITTLSGDLLVKDSNDNPMFVQEGYSIVLLGDASVRYLELLCQNACNGIYQSARDIEAFIAEADKLDKKGPHPYYVCETCGETFNDLNAFLCHLIETKHKDSIIENHPYDREIIRVKNLIENNN